MHKEREALFVNPAKCVKRGDVYTTLAILNFGNKRLTLSQQMSDGHLTKAGFFPCGFESLDDFFVFL